MPIFVFLHVLAMFIAVAMAYGPAMLMVAATRRPDVRSLRAITQTSIRLGHSSELRSRSAPFSDSWRSSFTGSTHSRAGLSSRTCSSPRRS